MEQELKHSIAVVADGPTCTGFRLAGVQNVHPIEALAAEGGLAGEKAVLQPRSIQSAAEARIEELLGAEEVGILMVSERTMNAMDWRLKKRIERAAKPVVIAVPDKGGPVEQADSLRGMIKKALGFELMK